MTSGTPIALIVVGVSSPFHHTLVRFPYMTIFLHIFCFSVFSLKALVTGRGGIPVILKKAMDEVTYSSLCLPDDIKGRGMEHIPNYLYRDDGMKIWVAIER